MNIFDYASPKTGEILTTILEHKNIKINRIVSSDIIELNTYKQDEDEWLLILEGGARLLIGEEEKVLHKGDTLFIASKTVHKVLETKKDTIWLTVHIF